MLIIFPIGKILLFHSWKSPPTSRIGGKPIVSIRKRGTLTILYRTHLELFMRCHQGTVLPCGELWIQVHTMDYVAATKGSRFAWANKFFPYLRTNLGIKYSKKHLMFKYFSCLHKYIQEEMKFLDIFSLGVAYRYAAKIEHKFKQKKRDFGYVNQKQVKGAPKP